MWRKITQDDLIASLSQEELEIYRSSASWSSDPIAALMKRAVAFARDQVGSNRNVRLSPDAEELPESVISPTVDYLVVDILRRIDAGVSEERKAARTEAITFFDKVATGKVSVESYPAEGTTSAVAAPEIAVKPPIL